MRKLVLFVFACVACEVEIHYVPCDSNEDCPGTSTCEDEICIERIYVPSEGEAEAEAEAEGEGEAPEVCDGEDNDNDGLVDEDFPELGEPCDGTDNNACPDGTFVCNVDGNGVACDDDIGDLYFETCNGLDDDCDGVVDEPPDPGPGLEWCGGEVGVCANATIVCTPDGGWECSFPIPMGEEICTDGSDNDCDGLNDCDDADDCPATLPECACATVTLYPSGETVGADGAPLFTLDAATPGGASIPGLGEVLRIRAEADPDCATVEVVELVVMIEFSDNAGSGWVPDNVTLRTPDGAVIAGPTNDYNDENLESGVRIVHLIDSFILEPNAPLHLLVFADTFGAAVGSSADTVRVSLIAPAAWRVAFEGAPTLETDDGLPVEGYTLFY